MNKKNLTIIFTSIMLQFVCFCQQKTAVSQKSMNPPPQSAPIVKEEGFIPPADSIVTTTQIKAWMSCNPLLDSLTFRYADSFKTTDPALRLRYQEDFSKAQHKLCIHAGLPGGYKEYTWILKNSGNPKNKAVLDSVGAQVQ